LLYLAADYDRWPHYQIDLAHQFGPAFSLKLLGAPRIIVISDAGSSTRRVGRSALTLLESAQHVLKKKFDNYPKGDFFRALVGDVLGNGIFTADGEHWSAQR
jgi:hypothetical protein